MPAYGLRHILWLIGIAGTAAFLSFLCRAGRLPHTPFRIAFACGLAGIEIERTVRDGLHFPDRMPFNLCNLSTWVAVLALIALWPLAVEFAYFVGALGACTALIMPDMGHVWPARFFLNHGGAVVAALVLVYGRMGRVRPGAVWRSLGLMALYLLFLGAFDWAFDVNYGFLRHKPEGVTIANLLGPWPIYIVSGLASCLFVFWLMWLPARRSAT